MREGSGEENVTRSLASRPLGVLDWFFRDRVTGRITIAQLPNPPLLIFLASVGLSWLFSAHASAQALLGGIGTAALAWWSIDEVLRGVNPWRRVLGGFGCAFVVLRLIALAR